jgi:hypothetical protein
VSPVTVVVAGLVESSDGCDVDAAGDCEFEGDCALAAVAMRTHATARLEMRNGVVIRLYLPR